LLDIDGAGWGDILDGVVLDFLRVQSIAFIPKVIVAEFF
jgi:hypothetical protein